MMTPEINLLLNLLIAVGLGALIGAQREMMHLRAKEEIVKSGKEYSAEFAGLRTHSFFSLLGFIGAYAAQIWSIWIFVTLLAAISLLIIEAYRQEANYLHFYGTTSETAAIGTFFIGAITYVYPLLAITLAAVIAGILALKKPLVEFVKNISSQEFLATLKFIIVAFVVLPILPRVAVDPWGFFVPYKIWLMIVFISAISFVGYVLIKTIGPAKGLGVTGLVGGLASSTAVTSSMAQQSRENHRIVTPFTYAIVIASAVMFVRVGFEVFVLNRALLSTLLIPLSAMLATAILVVGFLWWTSSHQVKKEKAKNLKLDSPFRFAPALKFGIFYLLIITIAELGNKYLGESGVYITSIISGLADVDAITITLSNLASRGELAAEIATRGITIAVLVNTLVKLVIVHIFGTHKLFRQAALGFAFILTSGLVAISLI